MLTKKQKYSSSFLCRMILITYYFSTINTKFQLFITICSKSLYIYTIKFNLDRLVYKYITFKGALYYE